MPITTTIYQLSNFCVSTTSPFLTLFYNKITLPVHICMQRLPLSLLEIGTNCWANSFLPHSLPFISHEQTCQTNANSISVIPQIYLLKQHWRKKLSAKYLLKISFASHTICWNRLSFFYAGISPLYCPIVSTFNCLIDEKPKKRNSAPVGSTDMLDEVESFSISWVALVLGDRSISLGTDTGIPARIHRTEYGTRPRRCTKKRLC